MVENAQLLLPKKLASQDLTVFVWTRLDGQLVKRAGPL